jgi:hypothetical protein
MHCYNVQSTTRPPPRHVFLHVLSNVAHGSRDMFFFGQTHVWVSQFTPKKLDVFMTTVRIELFS